MEVSNFDQLLHRYVNGQVSEQERAKLEAWLAVMNVENEKGLVMMPEDEERLFQRIENAAYTVDNVIAFRPFRYRIQRFVYSPYLKVAAAIFVVAASWLIATRFSGSGEKQIIASSEIKKVILDDGSIIWLHKDASISYNPETFLTAREISLKGQALFEVAKDATHPFAIDCGEMTVTVIGTSFNINAHNKEIELEVLTGKVRVSSGPNDKGIIVLPNEKIAYTPAGLADKAALVPADVASLTINTEYSMSFSATEMYQVIARLEKKFNVKFEIKNPEIKSCRITANLTDHSLESSLMIISELIDFKYVITGTEISVTGTGCK